ncbi:MAG TPA: hypothetical protein VNO22_13080 [Planctomycetota bacterium]|nr:hypothetical protein [Planctomycetota bacterium]
MDLAGAILAGLLAQAAPEAGDAYFPLAEGNRWVYRNDYDEETEMIHEVTGAEEVGAVRCLVLEYRTHLEAEKRTRVLRKEWLEVTPEGVRIHKVVRGLSTYPVEEPFFKLKRELRSGDAWGGSTRGSELAPRYRFSVEGEEDVQVPAGTYKAVRVRVAIESGERHAAEGHEWYAKGVGLVRSRMTIRARGEEVTIGAELKEFRKGPAK